MNLRVEKAIFSVRAHLSERFSTTFWQTLVLAHPCFCRKHTQKYSGVLWQLLCLSQRVQRNQTFSSSLVLIWQFSMNCVFKRQFLSLLIEEMNLTVWFLRDSELSPKSLQMIMALLSLLPGNPFSFPRCVANCCFSRVDSECSLILFLVWFPRTKRWSWHPPLLARDKEKHSWTFRVHPGQGC